MNKNAIKTLIIIFSLCILKISNNAFGFEVVEYASGFTQPLYLTAPPNDTTRVFVIEKSSGEIKIIERATRNVLATPFLTVTGLDTSSEGGLLSLAFHPDYQSNGIFYVYVTNSSGNSEIRRYTVNTSNPNLADALSVQTILSFSQPTLNHNGGWMGFGPDGFLYLCSGDGANPNDPNNSAQDISTLLGKVIRIDINNDDFPMDATRNYAIPNSNPYANSAGADEIWSYGLRNPWRCSFDRANGNFYIADVGEDAREEVNVQLSSSSGMENYGWRLREGTIATPTGGVGGPAPVPSVDPIYEYTHGSGTNEGFSITGGYVYRGPILSLQGHYLFADFISERIWSLKFDGSNPTTHDGTNFTDFTDLTNLFNTSVNINRIASFGEDADGNVYIVDFTDGQIFLIDIDSTDTDNDGVPDDIDQCPNTPTDETSNADGCSISQLSVNVPLPLWFYMTLTMVFLIMGIYLERKFVSSK